MRRDAELVGLGGNRRVIRQAECELIVLEGQVEPLRRQSERDCHDRQEPSRRPIHRAHVCQDIRSKVGKVSIVRPYIRPDETTTGEEPG
jgi:hypothetical protein